ncbi:phytoene desaturase family protein [Cesiribacter andamanensis]|uniref:Ribulose-1,5-biphosphate synthetase n=1 Tax=Cesiribacter andamanensis AMV16 TaxID=1279009 RepID=M7N9J7_9BACT|nr:NAD(P)/FAD-dependent oxidoreductase [Cesiribacter andamanensis]EMR03942.1 ribulose-1,5-biphosphate synthetase [Cesiribacter andamanensis AMV16]
MLKKEYDAVVVGSGPNGLAAAICLQRRGLQVLLLEGKETLGGGMRSAALTLPGFVHDICSAIHPLAAASPLFSQWPLQAHGLEFVYPPLAAAHPLEGGRAAVLHPSLEETVDRLGKDGPLYRRLVAPLAKNWEALGSALLGPLRFPEHPLGMARFGLKALWPASWLGRLFRTPEGRGLWAGMAAHSIQPLSNATTSAIALVLLALGHVANWPMPRGGAQQIATALADYFVSLGGKIETGVWVRSLDQLPSAHALLLDVSPRQLLQIAGPRFTPLYQKQLARYRYGMGVFKLDWALDGPIPFSAPECRQAGTVHLGNSLEEIAAGEAQIWKGRHPRRPYVLLAQQSLFDGSRAPKRKHTAWAYCHVPNGSTVDMTERIERQVERFAPGFRDLILARHSFNALEMEAYNPNYIGGDINGGAMDITQLFTRPALRLSPYTTAARGIYLCSSSTPPGGGVHGMCGYHAAKQALKEIWGLDENSAG